MKKALKNLYKSYFSLSKGERVGMFVLIGLILLLTVFPFIEIKTNKETTNFDSFDSLVNQLNQNSKETIVEQRDKNQSNKNQNTRFEFNPNTIEEAGLIELGFTSYLAKRIVNFRLKGGSFRKADDLYKIYGIDSGLVSGLISYIVIPSINKEENKPFEKYAYNNKSQKKVEIPTDINIADTIELKKIYGIGSKLANRIVVYREKLGGFYSYTQLNEVWGLNPSLVELLQKKFVVNKETIKKININTVEQKTLEQHPYIGFKTAKNIMAYKKQHGKFNKIEDIRKIISLKDSVIIRLNNYLIVE
jgi:competence ComEA-like helix-hairpin-helix protein